MKRSNRIGLCGVAVLALGLAVQTPGRTLGHDWLEFRGSPAVEDAKSLRAPPESWALDEKGSSPFVAWSSPISGRGVSGPILVGGKVIVTSASGSAQDRLHVICFDQKTGATLWDRQFWATGRTLCHPTSSVAANTPASDGERIFAFFSSNDIVALDLDGNLLWYRGLTFEHPTAANDVGMASSPVVAGNCVIVQVENKGESFATGLDVATGETRWLEPRAASMNWASPTTIKGKTPEDDLVLLQSSDQLTALNAFTGKKVWSHEAGCSQASSVTQSNGIVYLPAGGLCALKVADKKPEVLWIKQELGSNYCSPTAVGGKVYAINSTGVLTCANAESGETAWRVRLGGTFWATPVVVNDHIVCANQDGVVFVVKGGEQGEIVGRNELKQPIFGSPIVVDGAVYVRTDSHLWKVVGPEQVATLDRRN